MTKSPEHPTREGMPRSVARKLAAGAHHSDNAIVVGNRAGVIEWANEAWTRVTGYALDESISKPVASFLRDAEIDPSAIEFVSTCFHAGKICELDLPLTTPTNRELWVRLRVEPLSDESGELSDFIAIATDITDRKQGEIPSTLEEIDLNDLAAEVARAQAGALGERASFDFALVPELPPVVADRSLIAGLVDRLVCRAGEVIESQWGTITLSTGVLGTRGDALYSGDLLAELPRGHWVFLEVHDSGPSTNAVARQRISEPFLSTAFPRHAISSMTAHLLMHHHGGEIRMESEPWSGTSVVLLFPFA